MQIRYMSRSIPIDTGTLCVLWSHARVRRVLLITLCLLAALIATLPHSPANMPYVWPDSGTFQYVGQRLLEGKALYRDVWDQKPPLIYYLNASALWLAQGSRWGVWAASFLAVSAALASSVHLLRRAFGSMLALLVSGLWLLSYFNLIEDGNMTEEYALPLQFICLLVAYDVETRFAGAYRWRGVLIGLVAGLIFFFKSNAIGVAVAIGGYILFKAFVRRDARYALTNLAPLLGGFALVVAVMLAVLGVQGILYDFFVATIQFNTVYAQRYSLFSGTLDALSAGFDDLALTGLSVLGLFGFVIGVTCLAFVREKIPPRLVPLLAICAVALPLEIILVTTTRRTFAHYYVALLYVLGVWTAWSLWLLRRSLRSFANSSSPHARRALNAGFALGLGALMLPALRANLEFSRKLHELEPPEAVRYMRQHTTPEDTIVVLGYEPRLLLLAGRQAPTRFVHTIPLETPGFATSALVESYFDDILAHRPKLIVDPRDLGLKNFTPVDSKRIRRQVGRLLQLYRPVGRIAGWMVYELAPGSTHQK